MDEVVDHWRNGAKEALSLAQSGCEKELYSLALFNCHLAAEKWIKAQYIKEHDREPPHTHNLMQIAGHLQRVLKQEQQKILTSLSKYAVAARYDDRLWIEEEATEENVLYWVQAVQDIFTWYI